MTSPLTDAVRELINNHVWQFKDDETNQLAIDLTTNAIMSKLGPLLDAAEAMSTDRVSIMAQEPKYYDTCMGYVRYRDARKKLIAIPPPATQSTP